MKRIQFMFSMAAAIVGLSAAVAFSVPKPQFTNYWFDTNAAGNPTTYDPAGAQCSEPSGDYCSKEYAASQLVFSGSVPVSVINGQQDKQIAAAHLGD
jgi:hypothetical protein